jgi:hypothetical protein
MAKACLGLPVRCVLVSSQSLGVTRRETPVNGLIRFETLLSPDKFVPLENILLLYKTLASWE